MALERVGILSKELLRDRLHLADQLFISGPLLLRLGSHEENFRKPEIRIIRFFCVLRQQLYSAPESGYRIRHLAYLRVSQAQAVPAFAILGVG